MSREDGAIKGGMLLSLFDDEAGAAEEEERQRLAAEVLDEDSLPRKSQDGTGHVFAKRDHWGMAQHFLEDCYPAGLVLFQQQWWRCVNETAVWQVVSESGVKGAILPWLGRQYYLSAGFERRMTRDSAVASSIYETLTTMGDTGRRAFRGVPLSDSVLEGQAALQTLSGRRMTQEDFVTWVLPFKLEQLHGAGRPEKILRFLSGELEGVTRFRPEDIQIIQEFAGYCLIEGNQYQKGLWIQGQSRNGKSTILDLICRMLGEENIVSRSSKDFEDMANDDLLGKRLIYFPDYRRTSASDGVLQFLLNVIGNDPIRVRTLHVGGQKVRLPAKVIIASNFYPNLKDISGAVANRLLTISRQGPAVSREDPALMAELLQELPAFLKWALEGLAELHRRGNFNPGLIDPKVKHSVLRNTMPVFAFMEDRCSTDPRHWVSWRRLFAAWDRYAVETGHHRNLHMEEFKLGLEAAAVFAGTTLSDEGSGGEGGVRGLHLNDRLDG